MDELRNTRAELLLAELAFTVWVAYFTGIGVIVCWVNDGPMLGALPFAAVGIWMGALFSRRMLTRLRHQRYAEQRRQYCTARRVAAAMLNPPIDPDRLEYEREQNLRRYLNERSPLN